jgi:hypothetical protein
VLFHLPVTIFSCYQMTLPRSQTSSSSIVLAAFSFTFFSILIPAHLVLRVTFTPTNKLYDETRTLLSLGPLYNHYRHGSQMFACMLFATNLVIGITIGVGQKSGMAQAIIILVVEVISALLTSVWLPWGSGASMGLISFLFCVARIVIAVLLVILTPTVRLFSLTCSLQLTIFAHIDIHRCRTRRMGCVRYPGHSCPCIRCSSPDAHRQNYGGRCSHFRSNWFREEQTCSRQWPSWGMWSSGVLWFPEQATSARTSLTRTPSS